MESIIRLATEHDSQQVSAIYAPYVRGTNISFELEPPGEEEMRMRIRGTIAHLPWLVCERDEHVLGYAYAAKHGVRPAYDWSVNTSVYVDEGNHRAGIGRALYTSLFEILKLQGFHNAYAGITLPNPASVGMHERLGFRPVGVYRTVGYKHGAWHDVGYWQLNLRECTTKPSGTIGIDVIRNKPDWAAALSAGLRFPRSN